MSRFLFIVLLTLTFFSCDKDTDLTEPSEPISGSDYYFPPLNGSTWETSSPDGMGWDADKVEELYQFLEENNTRAFILLKQGRIVLEQYWGKDILGLTDFNRDKQWYWASAGKSLTAFLVGKAQEEGYLQITDKSSDYLGLGWTSLTRAQEDQITIWNQLTMTTGLNYRVDDLDCTAPQCLQYRMDPGEQWYYHNAPYTLLEQVVAQATNIDYNAYTDQKLQSTIGLQGQWRRSGYNNVYWSTARDAARFGLLILNGGVWDGQTILEDEEYLQAMTSPSQELNPAYGYLWWLNGQSKIVPPGIAIPLAVELSPNAPADLFAALGKNGQMIDVVPSLDLVVVRMGNSPDDALVPITFHDEMWKRVMDMVR